VKYVYPKNAYVTPEPMAVLKGAPHPKAGHAFIEFLLSEEGQQLFAALGVYPITPNTGPGSSGIGPRKSSGIHRRHEVLLDIPVGNVYDDKVAGDKKRMEDVNSYFRKEIAEKHKDIIKEK